MSAVKFNPLPEPPAGISLYKSKAQILSVRELFPYQHMLLRSWDEFKLSGVLVLNSVPTVYIRDDARPLPIGEAIQLQRRFWNQGIATVLILRDPIQIRLFSSMSRPERIEDAPSSPVSLVETIHLANQTLAFERFWYELANGHYYRRHSGSFNPGETVDAYLLDNLTALSKSMSAGLHKDKVPAIHTFLGRVLFTCYLIDRGIIDLQEHFPGKHWSKLHDLLNHVTNEEAKTALYVKLFPALKSAFNGSMFGDDIYEESTIISPEHLDILKHFLSGARVGNAQKYLNFWAYDFRYIPVETISAIYETFFEIEGGAEKRTSGAYYTPRFLAEMTLDVALEGERTLQGKRFIDPSCGSGIFLVLLFNRIAAEWNKKHRKASYLDKVEAFQSILGCLCGVDKQLTACRITCFSLYLAFLEQFDPSALKHYMVETGEKKLPSLLRFNDPKEKQPAIPLVWEHDFLTLVPTILEKFDFVVGNPPWAGRGKKQIAQDFMNLAPEALVKNGRACLLLPSKVFLNQTDTFQDTWLRKISLSKVVQLADYSFILFKNALCPCSIVRFENRIPDVENDDVEYIVPKVSRIDLRDGVIPVAPHDRMWITIKELLYAAKKKTTATVWKTRLWGTPRDIKFLDYLFTLPKLTDLVGEVDQFEAGNSRWCKGQGFQPLQASSSIDNPKPFLWPLNDAFITPRLIEGLLALPFPFAYKIGTYMHSRGYRLDLLHRPRNERIYQAPLVVINQGFSNAAFFDYLVRFQDSLQSIAGPIDDADYLRFLAVYLNSKLARYFIFHTAANVGTERDKAHFFEVLRLPFFLPDNDYASSNAIKIIRQISKQVHAVEKAMTNTVHEVFDKEAGEFALSSNGDISEQIRQREWFNEQRRKTKKIQCNLEPLIFEYFGLNEREIALVEDTVGIFDKSDTPGSLLVDIPTQQELREVADLTQYAEMITEVLNGWSKEDAPRFVATGCVDTELGFSVIELTQSKTHKAFHEKSLERELLSALGRLQKQSVDYANTLAYLRGDWIFDWPSIYIVKPAVRVYWTRTSAMNDASEIHAAIVSGIGKRNTP